VEFLFRRREGALGVAGLDEQLDVGAHSPEAVAGQSRVHVRTERNPSRNLRKFFAAAPSYLT
jgi:hypothetical protein